MATSNGSPLWTLLPRPTLHTSSHCSQSLKVTGNLVAIAYALFTQLAILVRLSSELINRVNEWLQDHPEWQAKTVESILFEPGSNVNKSVVYGANAEQQRKLFAVR